MQYRKHYYFIKTPIDNIIRETVLACKSVGDGMETYPLSEYIMQSLFIKMTGAQEQKFKCLLWELATDDYEIRLNNYYQKKFGGCSTYGDKNKIYCDFVESIKKQNAKFKIEEEDKMSILDKNKKTFENILDNTNIIKWSAQRYEEAIIYIKKIKKENIFGNNNIFFHKNNINLCDIYNHNLYEHRNRCAHNLISYQENMPSFNFLSDKKNMYNNYFLYFFILMLIDSIMRNLFDKYLEICISMPLQ